jgi:hypothetical protein
LVVVTSRRRPSIPPGELVRLLPTGQTRLFDIVIATYRPSGLLGWR